MTGIEISRLALEALAGNRVRSMLTAVSITIGAFSIVVMSSLAASGLETIARGIEDLGGARILFVDQKAPLRGEAKQSAYPPGFRAADRDRTFAGLPHVASLTLFSTLGKLEVTADSGGRATTTVVAADAGFFDVFRMRIGRGRAFTAEEDRGRAAVCVVGHTLAAKIGPRAEEPLGAFVTVGPLRCRIVGVLANNERFGTSFGFDWTDLVVTPGEAMGDLDPNVALGAAVFVKTDDPRSNEIVKRLVNARLSARHPGVDDFTLVDLSGVMEKFRAIFAGIELVVALLAGIALVVGGVGVMNMMLVAVSERVHEIGLRKALGASPRAIGAQFLAEAVLLSTIGGAAGVIAGLGVATLSSALIARLLGSWHSSLALQAAALAFVVTVVIGVGFGWVPARSAARLAPVEAMRR